MEIAVATHTAPAAWIGEDDRTLATVIDVLDQINKATTKATK